MFKKVKILLFLLSLTSCVCFMSTTYSRYVASTTGDINGSFAKWQILVDGNDITTNSSSTINIVPIIEENENIASNTIAPTSKGYFDININPSNVEVSFKYLIDLKIENEDIPDLIITKYAILANASDNPTELDIIYSNGDVISNTLLFDKTLEAFKFEPFIIRVFFEWFDGEDENMDDTADTLAINTANLKMSANISFDQILE